MVVTVSPTKRMRQFLKWARDAGIHRTWPIEWSVMHRKALNAGYIERCREADERNPIGFAAWRISEAGRAALRCTRQARLAEGK